MRAIFLRRLCAGVVGSMLVAPVAIAQQQGGAGGTSGTGQNTGAQTGATDQGTGQSGGNTSNASNYSGSSSVNQNSRSMFGGGSGTTNQGAGAGAGGTAGRSSTGRRSSTSTGQRGLTGTGLGASNLGRGGIGGQSGLQTNRQAARRAQFVTQLDQTSFASAPPDLISTLELRSTVEQSTSAAVPGGVQVVVNGSTVILSGKVSSPVESKLAERMALLEPGVRSVRNELVVETQK